MNLHEVNPFIRYSGLHSFYNQTGQNCICYDCRLFYLDKGDGVLYADGQSYTAADNTLVFLPPGTRYRFAFQEPGAVRIYVLNFDLTDAFYTIPKSLGTAGEDDFMPERMPKYTLPEAFSNVIVRPDSMHLRNRMIKCTEGFLKQAPYYAETASANLKLMLFEVLQDHQDSAGDALARSVSEYIRENYNMPELSNQMIAEHFNYHPYHLGRIMKAYTKQSLHSYLLDYRIHMAKNYLMTTNISVTMVAEKTGFASYSYFIKRFREKTGLSPHKWRQRHRNIGV